ncbi:MAG: adenylate/guanylate cyclase domain-containing protein, partial [Actinomycetota bacterium]|nr:adenylate/guanylate cyclase domain-containing protein [Actinomycetota bacterium]
MPKDRLPTGTVTFVFTDIEGSTLLLGRLGDRYPAVLTRHQTVLREAFADAGGREVSTEGDSFFVVFTQPQAAVAAAISAQRALDAEAWPGGERVSVRVGIHTGQGVMGGDNYTGVDVHRAARIAAAGHGGQILVSAATQALVEPAPPEGVTFRDLGEHTLKDLPRPERLYQVAASGLAERFPPIRSVEGQRNLPQQLTTFVGRRREIDDVKEALGENRLVTLTGPGGTGKTRLSIQIAGELAGSFEAGAAFVPLAPIADAALVMSAVADALELREASDRMPIETVIDHLRDREALLVLDNLEQVLEAASEVGQLLTEASGVRILATSREPLGLHGEREYPVPPLEMPDPRHLPPLDSLSQYAAVELFVQRATSVKPGFAVTNENAPAVAEICARLDGLPLAIELAAARVKILSPQDLLKRLDQALSFLATRERDRPTRQQTLRDAIAWSYDLLDDDERRLFAELAVFKGGFTLDAADAVWGAPDAFDLVAALVNKSLIRQTETRTGETRFLMLETIRQFAVERLGDRSDAEEVRGRHARHFLELARRAAPNLFGEDRARWLSELAAEHDNFRAALDWAARSQEVDLALRLAGHLWRFWQMRGHLREAAERFRSVLTLPGTEAHPEARAEALEGAGGTSYWMGEWGAAETYYLECLDLRRGVGDPKAIADAAYNLSFVYTVPPEPLRDIDRARPFLQEALDAYRSLDDRRGIANVQWALSNLHIVHKQHRETVARAREAFDLFEEVGDRFGAAWAAHSVGMSSVP